MLGDGVVRIIREEVETSSRVFAQRLTGFGTRLELNMKAGLVSISSPSNSRGFGLA